MDAPTRLDRSAYVLDFDESFAAPNLDRSRWLPHYLPQWSTRAQSAARYEIRDATLRLRIDEDQPPWSPEYDGELRVSNLQTGVFSGPAGSTAGQHRFRPGLVVTEAQQTVQLYTPKYGLVEARARALDDPRCMVALWMIGFEEVPEQSGELCVFEIFGRDVADDSAVIGMGVHPFGDAALTEEFLRIYAKIDAREFHTYSIEWMPGVSRFYLDDVLIATIDQAPGYPMQLMLNVYEFSADEGAADGPLMYPKEFVVDFVRGYRPRG
jgi:hypothetical protein